MGNYKEIMVKREVEGTETNCQVRLLIILKVLSILIVSIWQHCSDEKVHFHRGLPNTETNILLVGPEALEQLVSLERLTYVAYFVLVTCFLVFRPK